MSEEIILNELKRAVIDGDEIKTAEVAKRAIKALVDPMKAFEEGLSKGLREIGEMFKNKEVFLPELVMAAEAMKAGIRVLEPELKKGQKKGSILGRVMIGTVAGDIHDIGKNVVATLLTIEGFEVIDLGTDVSAETFVRKVRESKPDVLGMSSLLTMSILQQEKTIQKLKKAGLRDHIKVIIGGAPVTQEYADRIGADAYGFDGFDAIKKVKALLEIT